MSPIRLRVRELREAKGWSQSELARRAGTRFATINSLERRQPQKVDLGVLEKVADALGVDAAFLIVHETATSAKGSRRGAHGSKVK